MVEAAPGDPFTIEENLAVDPQRVHDLRAIYGLDRPLPSRYLAWLGAAARGEWGVSLRARRPVAELLGEALPASLVLGAAALILATMAGAAMALLQVRLREAGDAASALERRLDQAALLLYCVPTFWVGQGLVDLFSYRLGWLPPSHLAPAGGAAAAGPLMAALHFVLPVVTLALAPGAAIARHLRASLLDAEREGFVQAARARGAGPAALLGLHRLRVCLGPALALVGLHLPYLAGGALLVEIVFALPGMGRLAYDAALGRDYPVLMAVTLAVSASVVAGGLLTDLLQAWADPRLRHAGPSA